MFSKTKKRGVVLFIVIVSVIIVSILASVVLTIILNQFRLTHHQTSRTQAYYAAQAGMNYAIEKLRLGNDVNWSTAGTYTRHICWTTTGCPAPVELIDPGLPSTIQSVDITVYDPVSNPGINNTRQIKVTATYTYVP